jgi:uncharacterized protein YneF (UPF0154 family)
MIVTETQVIILILVVFLLGYVIGHYTSTK